MNEKLGITLLLVCCVLIIPLALISVSSFMELRTENYMNFKDSRWVCIAQACTVWATGDDWISDNCRPEGKGNNISLVCDIVHEGKNYKAPLSVINLTGLRSCRQWDCVTEILVKGAINLKNQT